MSVVVPVYDVEEYLDLCLDSLLEDPSLNLEVVAVDDCSTDSSPKILDAYALADPRLRIVRPPENGGLGAARNLGLGLARGEFVWFVDSDDWVAGGSPRRILETIGEIDPDVLLIGHARVRGCDVQRPASDLLLSQLPTTFTAVEAPQIFELSSSACVKVVRKRLLVDHGLTFPDGAYEDKPVAIPLLLAADRISAIADVCYFYRQRAGSIVHARGRHHVDLLRQLDLVHDRIQVLGSPGSVIDNVVFSEAVRYVFHLLGTERIASRDRAAFLDDAAAFARRCRPTGYDAPSLADAVRLRLLLRRWLVAIDALSSMSSRLRGTLSSVRAATASVRRRTERGLSHVIRRSALRLYYRMQQRRPIDPDLVLYSAYWGREILTCNPGAIYAKTRELAPAIRGVWAVSQTFDDRAPDDVEVVRIGTPAYYRTLARSRVVVSNTNLTEEIGLRAGTTFVHTHHGTPLKTMGLDIHGQSAADASQLLRRCSAWDVTVSANPHSSSVWRRAYPVPARVLDSGYPRNDVLVHASPGSVREARDAIGLDHAATTILYAPTFRDGEDSYRARLDPHELVGALGPGHVVLVRSHYFYEESGAERANARHGQVIDASTHRIDDLCLAADVLITDFSSVMFDYAILDRPIVVFAPDWEAYSSERGTYFDLAHTRPGPFVRSFEHLCDTLASGQYDDEDSRRRRQEFRQRFCAWEDGSAAERVAREIGLIPVTGGDSIA